MALWFYQEPRDRIPKPSHTATSGPPVAKRQLKNMSVSRKEKSILTRATRMISVALCLNKASEALERSLGCSPDLPWPLVVPSRGQRRRRGVPRVLALGDSVLEAFAGP